MSQSRNWFNVSDMGWRRINAGRQMGHLIREGIANSLDQDDVKNIHVFLGDGWTTIEDDGPTGITDPELISVIFMTDKEDNHKKRGRKGRGLKELIAVADKAIVETKGLTVTFDDKGRTEEKNIREAGTKISIFTSLDSWKDEKVHEAAEYLKKIIPPAGKTFVLNGTILENPKLECSFEARLLTTVVKDGIQKEIYENGNVNIHQLRKGQKQGWIYEMGIPIQNAETPYDIDVQQRIPMNDNRDVISPSYINNLLGRVLDNTIDKLDKQELRQSWAITAAWFSSAKSHALYAEKLVGANVIIASKNKRANDLVKQSGFKVVETDSLPSNIRDILDSVMKGAEAVAKTISDHRNDKLEQNITSDMIKFKNFTEWLGHKVLNHIVKADYFQRDPDYTGFVTQADYCKPLAKVRFNTLCKDNDFSKPLSASMLSVMIHEFAHEFSDEHEDDFHKAVERLAGEVCNVLVTNMDEVRQKFGDLSAVKGKTVFISCCDCGAQREIKVQDRFQVRRCRICQRAHKNKA